MTKYITKHSELVKLHGKKVTCKIDGEFIDDAMIYIDGIGRLSLLNNIFSNYEDEQCLSEAVKEALNTEYNRAIWIYFPKFGPEDNDSIRNDRVTEIQLVEEEVTLEDLIEAKKVTIKEAIEQNLESKDKVGARKLKRCKDLLSTVIEVESYE